MITSDLVGCKMLWTGTGNGETITLTSLTGWKPFPATLTGKTPTVEIFNPAVPTEREIARGLYTHAGLTFARTIVRLNSTTQAAGTRLSFSAGSKEVSLVLDPDDLAGVLHDGITIREGPDFTAGGTFTVDPTNRQHRHIQVVGSAANGDLLTAPMTVALDPTSLGWSDQIGFVATVSKDDASTNAVTVSGFNIDGLGTRALVVDEDHVWVYRETAATGPNGFKFTAVALDRAGIRAKMISAAPTATHADTNKVLLYDSAGVFLGAAPWAHGHLLSDIDTEGLVFATTPISVTDIDATGTPDSTTFLNGSGAWTTPSGAAAPAPSQVLSTGSPFALTTAMGMHLNVEVVSHADGVDFEVPAAAAAAMKWYIRPKHLNCTVSVTGNSGSVNGAAGGVARGVKGGVAVIEVDANPGSAPVVLVSGNVIITPIQVNAGKTYTDDDDGQEFELITGASTQNFSDASTYIDGFMCHIYNDSGGNIIINGTTNDHTLVDPGVVTVKKLGTQLWALGSGGITVLATA